MHSDRTRYSAMKFHITANILSQLPPVIDFCRKKTTFFVMRVIVFHELENENAFIKNR